MSAPSLRVTALGGGHGLAATLTALRHLDAHLTGIVTVADNGGSSGRLREEFGIVPPGDLRMALAALCGDDEWGRTWADILQHRFSGDGPLGGHALGNLLLATTWDHLGDTVAGLRLVGQLLRSEGQVLPMSSVPLDIEADVEIDGQRCQIRGQAQVAEAGHVVEVRLDPADPPACPEAIDAVRDADWVVVGPGSWFTSVMPTLLVPELRRALISTTARRALVLNLVSQPGETDGLNATDHLDVLAGHAPDLRFDVVIADSSVAQDLGLEAAAHALGAEVIVADVTRVDASDQHDPTSLAAVFSELLIGHRVGATYEQIPSQERSAPDGDDGTSQG
jgi:uncharacterized cofD-like protein